jgi:RNA polymerase sigma-70 factor (ECF subfamily)
MAVEPMGDPTDADLVARILAGDREAATRLFRRHLPGVYAFVHWRVGGRRDAAEEVTQEVFLDTWRNLRRFDRGRELWPWLCGIAVRKIARFHRSAARVPARDVPASAASADPSPVAHAVDGEIRTAVGQALSGLRPSHRDLLLGKYVEMKSLAEIGREMGLSEAAVSSGLQRARQALRDALLSLGRKELVDGG